MAPAAAAAASCPAAPAAAKAGSLLDSNTAPAAVAACHQCVTFPAAAAAAAKAASVLQSNTAPAADAEAPPCVTLSAAAAAAAAAGPDTVPLHQLQLSSHAPLQAATRQRCPSCSKPRAFFCYDCLIPLTQGMPHFTALPVEVHIVMHGESNAQATGTHAAVLAPQCVTLWRHTDGTSHHRRQPASKLQLPDWDPQTTAVLYPESPETPVVRLWGRLERLGSCQQSNRQQQQQQQQQRHEGGTLFAGKQQAAQHQARQRRQQQQQQQQQQLQQQQPAVELLLAELQRLACSGARGAACSAGSCSYSSECSCQPHAEQHPGCSSSAGCAAAAAMHGASVDSGSASSAAADGQSSTTFSSSSSSGSSSSMKGQQPSLFPYKTVVILEGSWAKARTLLKHAKLAGLPRLQLPPSVRSLFWRRGTGSFRAAVDCGVCTIEALYLLCRQLQPQPEGCWDDLLWLWVFQRQLVQTRGSRQTRREMQRNYEAACGAA